MCSINPTIEWYISKSRELDLSPRCPFASEKLCPRYYMSLSLLKHTGATNIDPKEDARLLEKWRKSPLWPSIAEQEPGISSMGNNDHFRSLAHFCPEVTFERFGYFASFLSHYSDEIDRDHAHMTLNREYVSKEDWRWLWSGLEPMHYSKCSTYSPLAHSNLALNKIPEAGKNYVNFFFDKIKQYPWIALLIIFGIIVIAVGNFTDAVNKIIELILSLVPFFNG